MKVWELQEGWVGATSGLVTPQISRLYKAELSSVGEHPLVAAIKNEIDDKSELPGKWVVLGALDERFGVQLTSFTLRKRIGALNWIISANYAPLANVHINHNDWRVEVDVGIESVHIETTVDFVDGEDHLKAIGAIIYDEVAKESEATHQAYVRGKDDPQYLRLKGPGDLSSPKNPRELLGANSSKGVGTVFFRRSQKNKPTPNNLTALFFLAGQVNKGDVEGIGGVDDGTVRLDGFTLREAAGILGGDNDDQEIKGIFWETQVKFSVDLRGLSPVRLVHYYRDGEGNKSPITVKGTGIIQVEKFPNLKMSPNLGSWMGLFDW